MVKLLKCSEHDEIFEIDENGYKHWLQTWDTFTYFGYKIEDVKIIPLEELRDKYSVGATKVIKTVTEIKEGQKPKDIFYPVISENPWKWVRGLLTLGDLKPAPDKILGLNFNLVIPYASSSGKWAQWVSLGGKIIPCTKSSWINENGVVAYATCDEPDCRKHNPYEELELYHEMKAKTDKPIGTILCGDIGCGHEGTASTKVEYKRQWLEVLNQMDLVIVDNYPYRSDWSDPIAKLEEFHQFYLKNITVPIIMIVQAHWGYHNALIQPNPMEQVKFWVERGYGYIAYPWKDELNGVIDMQEEWKQANKYKQEAK